MANILIVEDEGLIAEDLRHRLAKLGHAVCGWAASGIYVTSCNDHATLRRASLTRPSDYLLKPFDDRELEAVVKRAIPPRAS